MNIPVTCGFETLIEVSKIKELQGNLKARTPEQLTKLKNLILSDLGFSFPLYIWQNENKNYTLDGHGRLEVVKQLIKEGYKFEYSDGTVNTKLPCVFIQADNLTQAKKKLLSLNSSYGSITEKGLYDFTADFKIEFEDFKINLELPNIKFGMDYNPINKDKEINQLELKNKCPACNYEW